MLANACVTCTCVVADALCGDVLFLLQRDYSLDQMFPVYHKRGNGIEQVLMNIHDKSAMVFASGMHGHW